MGFDLHNHSYFSDGIHSPSTLVKLAKERGLDGLALTDHDTLSDVEEFIEAGRKAEVIAFPGVELTTQHHGVELHILGYGLDYRDQALCRRLYKVIESRIHRAKEIVHRLQRSGIDLAWEDVENVCQNTHGKYVGRPHIYRALKAKGIIGPDPERLGFRYYLGAHGLAYVPHHELPTLEGLDLIRTAHGLPVLAHPGRLDSYNLVRTLKENGLAGIEVFYPTHSLEVTRELLQIAEEYKLFPTGGSDYHGELDAVQMGTATVERRFIKPLLQRYIHRIKPEQERDNLDK